MSWDRKRLLGYVETIQLISEVTDNNQYPLPEGIFGKQIGWADGL